MYIWLYWENAPGETRPAFIDLCYESILHHCKADFDIVLVTPETLNQYLPDLGDLSEIACTNKPSLRISTKTNFIRVALLAAHGGIWTDIDNIALRSWKSLIPLIEAYGFVCYSDASGRHGRVFPVGFMGARTDNPLLVKFKETLDRKLDEKNKFKSCETGWLTLTPLLRATADKDYHILSESWYYPIEWHRWRDYFSTTLEPGDTVNEDTLFCMLAHWTFPEEFKQLSKEEVLSGNALISKFFRLALQE